MFLYKKNISDKKLKFCWFFSAPSFCQDDVVEENSISGLDLKPTSGSEQKPTSGLAHEPLNYVDEDQVLIL